ncbi:ATP-binding cassette domain-containing protein [Streptococcus dentapri]|uniref:ATP-binding cassette domain-containing protein n=1 Tax=Streptococcus dentapri TaxID=573564 RepID=A0ABV8D235_9STRE
MSLLKLQNIHKSYYLGKEEFPVLNGINLSFDKGDFVSILGESGGGKSTLMNIIGGLDREYTGDVIINGERQKDKREKALDEYRRQTIGFISQSFNLINYLSVLDNVLISLKMTQLSHKEQLSHAEDLLKQVGLFEHRKKKPAQLSGGQKQRVAIARALASNPEIIIADEPTGALDSKNTREVLTILQDIAKSGKTVIVVTHSQEVAEAGTRIISLVDGQVTNDQRLREPFSSKEKETIFDSKPLTRSASWKMAWAHFRSAWKQNLIIAIGMAIGLFSVMFFLGLGNGARGYMNSFIADIANPKAFQVTLADARRLNSTGMTAKDKDRVANTKHVIKTQYGYYAPLFNVNYKGETTQSQVLQTINDTIVKKNISSKKLPKDDEIIVSKDYAKRYISKDIKKAVGQKITITLSAFDANGQPVAISKEYTIAGTVEGMNLVTYKSLQDAAAAQNAKLKPNFITASMDDLNNTKEAQNTIKAMKKDGKNLYSITGIGGMLDSIVQVTYIVSFVLAMIAGISLLVSILMIVATTYMSVTERTKEIGILRSMGARRKDIRHLFVNESLLLGISANIMAIITALLIQALVNRAVYSTIKYDIIQISLTATITTVIIGLLIALIASLAPSSKAARLNTIDALASE